MKKHRLMRALAVFLVSVGITLGPASPARASHFDNIFPNGYYDCYIDPICLTDSADVFVYVGNLGPRFQDATELALNGSYDTTALDISYSGSQTSNTDIYYEYASLPFPTLGTARCMDPVNSLRCNQHRVRYDSDQACSSSCSDNFLRSIACHESGHSVGLTHGDQASPTVSNLDADLGCLRTPLRRSSPYYALGGHNAGQINGEY
jgi:hypothetical protein